MNVAITFRQMEATEALKQYVHTKLHKIEKFFLKPVDVHVIVSIERHLLRAEINVQDKQFSAHAKEECEDMYVSIDRAIEKVGKSLKKHKDKIKDNKAHGSTPAGDIS